MPSRAMGGTLEGVGHLDRTLERRVGGFVHHSDERNRPPRVPAEQKAPRSASSASVGAFRLIYEAESSFRFSRQRYACPTRNPVSATIVPPSVTWIRELRSDTCR